MQIRNNFNSEIRRRIYPANGVRDIPSRHIALDGHLLELRAASLRQGERGYPPTD